MKSGFGRQFLSTPELFPARLSGESCGEHEVCVDFLGGPYLFKGCGAVEVEILRGLFGDLCVNHDSIVPGAVEITTLRVDPVAFREFSLDGWENTLDLDFTSDVISITGLQFMARIELTSGFRAAIWISDINRSFERLAFSNFFRVLAAYRLNRLGGGLLHSAGIAAGDEAYLFCGESGAGKTTLASAALNAGMEILSDDLNAVFPDNGKWYAAKVPFAGMLNRNNATADRYPIRFLGFLRKSNGQKTALTSTSGLDAAAIAELIAASPFLNIDPYRVDSMMDNLQMMACNSETGVVSVSLKDDVRHLFAGFSRRSKQNAA